MALLQHLEAHFRLRELAIEMRRRIDCDLDIGIALQLILERCCEGLVQRILQALHIFQTLCLLPCNQLWLNKVLLFVKIRKSLILGEKAVGT